MWKIWSGPHQCCQCYHKFSGNTTTASPPKEKEWCNKKKRREWSDVMTLLGCLQMMWKHVRLLLYWRAPSGFVVITKPEGIPSPRRSCENQGWFVARGVHSCHDPRLECRLPIKWVVAPACPIQPIWSFEVLFGRQISPRMNLANKWKYNLVVNLPR